MNPQFLLHLTLQTLYLFWEYIEWNIATNDGQWSNSQLIGMVDKKVIVTVNEKEKAKDKMVLSHSKVSEKY